MAAGNVTALCMYLISGNCSRYASPTGLFPATPTQTACEGFFAGFQPGTDADTGANTIGCRQHYAKMAETPGSEYYCQYASLTGGGVCGVPLNNTCTTITTICPSQYANFDACYTDLVNLNGTFGSLQGPPGSENTLECRAYHATASVVLSDPTHCGHVTAAAAPCHANDAGGFPKTNMSHYCGLIELTCTGNKQQFFGSDAATMWKSCSSHWNTWTAGSATFGASTPDQAGHQYHIFANANAGGNSVHCAHAGPSGGGVVGTTYQAWQQATTNAACALAANNNTWVAAQVGEALADWPALLPMVVPLDPAPGSYNVPAISPANANTETCRIYHLTAAATGAISHCSHGSILGGGQCPLDATIPLCALIATACPSNYNTTSACSAAFMPYFTNPMMMGDPNMMGGTPPATDTLACRLFYATLAIRQKGMMNTTNTTLCANAKVGGALACGMMMAPTGSGAAFVAVSSFSSLLMLLW